MFKVTASAHEQRVFKSLEEAMAYYDSISFDDLSGMLFKQVMRVVNAAPVRCEPFLDNAGIVVDELVGDGWE